jgi:hypothetical protein
MFRSVSFAFIIYEKQNTAQSTTSAAPQTRNLCPMFTECSLDVQRMFTECSLKMHAPVGSTQPVLYIGMFKHHKYHKHHKHHTSK